MLLGDLEPNVCRADEDAGTTAEIINPIDSVGHSIQFNHSSDGRRC